MTITGDMLIGFSAVRGTEGSQRAFNPASNSEISEPSFGMGGAAEVERAASLAAQAFDVFRNVTLAKRAAFLDAIADNILGIGDELIERAHAETGLPITRLQGERGRTVGQLRLFAKVVRDGHFLGSTIDHAQPERQPLPRADLRLAKVPVGPVAVFGASNFPLAFSVAGGDTASALAAGAPVIVKAHGAHLGTSELVGRAIQKAVREHGLPEGVFSLLFGAGRKLGEALVAHPVIKAVGFTGSRQGGLALVRIANARAEPIPVYAEMSSINPVFLFPGALASRAEAIGKAFADSLTLGAGQFCTNPGLVLAIDGPDLDRFIKAAGESLAAKPAQTMLTPGIFDAFRSGAQKVDGVQGVTKVAQGVSAGELPNAAQAALYVTDAQRLLATPELEAEMFGPASVVIRARDFDELLSVAEHVEGQLTVTLQIDAVDYADAQRLLPILERKAGRILANGFPTGVEVCNAMVHGGPFPSTSNPMFTSVGATAIDRFLRPVCYQDLPDALLPAAVKEANPLAVWRLVDGELTGGARDNGDSVAGPSGSGSKPHFLIVHPRNEESYWQPVPANGYASVHVAPHLVSMQRPFSAGTQTVPPGGFVRLHAHAESEEVLHFIRGKGKAVVEGRDYLIEPGMTIFLGPQQSHTLINDGAEDLHWVWFFLPSGIETFFKAIGRQRSPGDDAPDAFERPENVSAIEASTGFSPVTQKRLG